MIAQGSSYAVFERAIERNLLVAENTVRVEIPHPSLRDLLELTDLIAVKNCVRSAGGITSVRWRTLRAMVGEADRRPVRRGFQAEGTKR